MLIVADHPDPQTLSDPGPLPGLSLASCAAAGCVHPECAAAAAAHERLEPLVPAAGSARRLQALSYVGWPVPELAARLSVEPLDVCALLVADPAGVRRGLAAAVAVLYDALWDRPGPSRLVAEDARGRGWCPALAWDDHEGDPHWIDDPAAGPAPCWRPARRLHLAGRSRPATVSRAELAAALAAAVTGRRPNWLIASVPGQGKRAGGAR